jgi:phage regulator Rha-like protein
MLTKLDQAFTEFSKIRTDRAKVLEGNKEMNKKIEQTLTDLDKYLRENDSDARAFIIHDSDKYYHSIE